MFQGAKTAPSLSAPSSPRYPVLWINSWLSAVDRRAVVGHAPFVLQYLAVVACGAMVILRIYCNV